MGYPIPITPQQLKLARKQLAKEQEIICANPQTYVKLLLVGREMLEQGEQVKAKITPGYKIVEVRGGKRRSQPDLPS